MGPLLQQEGEQVSGFPACFLGGWGVGDSAVQAVSLYGVRAAAYPGVGPEGWLRLFAYPLGGAECRGHVQCPAFCCWLFRSGSWAFFGLLYLLSRICPNCTCTQLFLVPYSFFVSCCSRSRLSRCKHGRPAAEGPRSQPVSFLLCFV